MFSDSDWASHKASRKSVSSGMIFFSGCLLLATSRSQRTVALSSAEAELHAAVSTVCHGVLLKECLTFSLNIDIIMKLSLDNAAARQILFRSGVGRVRHLSCRILWVQGYVKEKKLEAHAVPTKLNCADLGTKRLSKDRMEFLMNMVGVFDESADELVGEAVVQREKQAESVSYILRILRESVGERATHMSVSSSKRALQCMMLMALLKDANALSPVTNDICWVEPSIQHFDDSFWPMVTDDDNGRNVSSLVCVSIFISVILAIAGAMFLRKWVAYSQPVADVEIESDTTDAGELEEPNVEIPQGVSKDFQRFAHRLALQIRELRHLRDEAEANGNLALAADYTAQINQLNPFDGNFGSNALPVLQAPGVEATEEPEPQPGVQGDPADVEPVCKQDGMHNTM